MALIIEDGSIVANANSFNTDIELVSYAEARNATIPDIEAERDALQIKAIDYLFSKESKMKGCRVDADQELPYPRRGVCLYGFNIASDAIPKSLKNAQLEAAIQLVTSELLVNTSVQNVAKEKLGSLEVEYFSGGSWTIQQSEKIDAYLKELLIRPSLMERV